jgi:hypothetical protein
MKTNRGIHAWRTWLQQQRGAQVDMTARRQHHRTPHMVGVPPHPVEPLGDGHSRRTAARRRR